MSQLPEKPCTHCGRMMTWRKRWAQNWDSIKFCSPRCRSEAKRDSSAATSDEENIMQLLSQRARGATICPSEILSPEQKQDERRMEMVRQAARRLQRQGQIDILRRGQVVDPDQFRGPIRLRRREMKR